MINTAIISVFMAGLLAIVQRISDFMASTPMSGVPACFRWATPTAR